MTSAPRQQGRRLVLLAILVVATLLAVAFAAIGPALFQQVSVSYGAPEYLPERAEYCPGEVMRVPYQIARRQPGPVEIIGSWCTPAGACALPLSTIQYGNVAQERPSVAATLTITIPVSERMTPGSEWVYVRSVRQTGQEQFSMFTVPFRIKADCPAGP